MNHALGNTSRRNQGSLDRNFRADQRRTTRYRAGRIVRGETPRDFLSNEDICQLTKITLRETYEGLQAPTQEIAEDAGQSKKAAENWWNGENPMGPTAFINAYRNNPRFAAFARYYLLGHTENDPIVEIQLQTAMANMGQAAARLGMPQAQFAAACGFAMGHTITADVLAMDNSAGGAGADHDDGTGDLFEEAN